MLRIKRYFLRAGYLVLLVFLLSCAVLISNPILVFGKEAQSREFDKILLNLSSGDVETAYEAALALGELKDPRVIPPLVKTLESTEYEAVSNAASMALANMGIEAVDPVSTLLTHEKWWVRKNAAWVLGRLHDVKALSALLNALKDDSGWVRLYAAWALGKISDKSAMEALKSLSQTDAEETVRNQAKSALEQIEKPTGEILVKDAPICLLIIEQDIPNIGVRGDRIGVGGKLTLFGFEFESTGKDEDTLTISPFLPGVVYLKGSGKITYSKTGRSVQIGSIQNQAVKQEVNKKEEEISVINVDDLNLQGIFWGEDPKKVIIADKRTQKTYVLKEDESLGEIRVGKIAKDKVTLEYQGRKVDLSIEK